jgi:uncharacterized tellurite resistance protein B-like protein/uncharacterized protein (DUF697 family)
MTKSDKPSEKSQAPAKGENLAQKLQIQLAEKMMGTFDLVLSRRSKYYSEHPDRVPPPSAITDIINSYATMNMTISGSINLIPGPWGMAAAIPEVTILIRNQLAMIYDIGVAHGKSNVLNKELLAGVFLSAIGVSAGGLLVMHGGKVLVRRVALRVFQQVIKLLAGKVTQQMLKSLVTKWVPIAGAAAMAAWSNYSTRQIGKKAAEILAKPIEVIEEESNDESIIADVTPTRSPANVEAAPNFTTLKIKALINLMKVDKKIKPEERGYIQLLIENSDLDEETKIELANLMDVEAKTHVDFAPFVKEPDEVIGLLIDLIGLAKRDGEFHLAEKIYIKQAGKLMGISGSDIDEAMTTEPAAV